MSNRKNETQEPMASSNEASPSALTGLNLRRIRRERGLSSKQLAEILGTSGAQLSRLEKGKRRFTDIWLNRIAKALDVTVNELVSENATNEEIVVSYAAGRRQSDELETDEQVRLRLPVDCRYPNAHRYAVQVETAEDGKLSLKRIIIICAPLAEQSQAMSIGDLYHVRKLANKENNEWNSYICRLEKDSSDKLFLSPCAPNSHDKGIINFLTGSADTIVTGTVIGKYEKI